MLFRRRINQTKQQQSRDKKISYEKREREIKNQRFCVLFKVIMLNQIIKKIDTKKYKSEKFLKKTAL